MRKFAVLVCLAAMFVAAGALHAASTIYGISGLIEVPDETITTPATVDLTAHYISEVRPSDERVITFGGTVGILPKLEVGAAGFDSDAPGAGTEVLVNLKYRVLDESLERPSITLGVVDLANQLDDFNPGIDDPSFFIVFGKNITSAAEGFSGLVSKPLRGYFGFGTGVYGGIFLGLNWSVAPKFDVLAEYLSDGIRQSSTFNAGLRYTPVGPWSIQFGTIDFDSLYVGTTFSLSKY